MANVVFTYGKSGVLGAINLATDTIKAALLMSNNTVSASGQDAQFLSSLTLDECDGSGYSRQTLSVTVSAETASDKGKVDAVDLTFSLVGASTRTVTGVLFYKHVGADSANIPILYMDTATGLPLTPSGADINFIFAAAGLFTQE